MLIALALIITPALVAWLAMTLTARQAPPASSVDPRTLASLTEARFVHEVRGEGTADLLTSADVPTPAENA